MKYFLFILLILFSVSSCKKNKEEIVINNGLVGKWKLVKSGIGIGGGGGYIDADPAKPEIIEFKLDSTFTANQHSIYLNTFTGYKLINSSEIFFLPNNIANRNWAYSINNGAILKLYMPCIEACILEYKAIK